MDNKTFIAMLCGNNNINMLIIGNVFTMFPALA